VLKSVNRPPLDSLGEKELCLAWRPVRRALPLSIAPPASNAQQHAHSLVDMGVPVFACSLKSNGDPIPRKGWETTKPSHRAVEIWQPGMALCAVTGVVYDVIDIDPRNGGQLSLKRLARKLGEDGPTVYWEVSTASGGTHLYIAKLDIGSHPGFLPGIDLKGGLPDGTSRGFVFIPPTVRPSKAENNAGKRTPYRQKTELYPVNDEPSIAALKKAIPAYIAENKAVSGKAETAREAISDLKQECLDAPAGAQRTALLRYTFELERKGYDRNDILVLLAALVKEMPQYNERRPWRASDLRGLLHKPGEVTGDAAVDELGSITPKVLKGGLQAYSTIAHEITSWTWGRHIAFGDGTILDGDAGLGKSLVTLDVAARLSSGRAMPAEPEALLPPLPVLLLAPEDRPAVTAGRLQAAGAEMSNVFRPMLGTVEIERRGEREKRATHEGNLMVFPDAIVKFRRWIQEYNIKLVVIDPISAFLSERTNSNNDASVRRALEPLSIVLGELGCAAIMIRHLNKNTTQEARYRGGGSVAFGAVARIQLLAGELPDGTGRFGIGQIKNNHLERRPDEVLTYEIQDSEIVADELGNMVPRIHWGDYINMELRALAGVQKRGPKPERRHEIEQLLEEMFQQQDTWPMKEIEAAMKSAGVSINHKTVATAREELGIRSRPAFSKDGGVKHWVWTTVPIKRKRNG
jgi:RecA-family ATPase